MTWTSGDVRGPGTLRIAESGILLANTTTSVKELYSGATLIIDGVTEWGNQGTTVGKTRKDIRNHSNDQLFITITEQRLLLLVSSRSSRSEALNIIISS